MNCRVSSDITVQSKLAINVVLPLTYSITMLTIT